MPLPNCDRCFAAGPDSVEAKNIRTEYTIKTLWTVSKNIGELDYPHEVLVNMFERHMTKKHAEEALLSICESIGEERAIEYAEMIDGRE